MYDRAGMPMKKPKSGDNSEGVPQGGSLWIRIKKYTIKKGVRYEKDSLSSSSPFAGNEFAGRLRRAAGKSPDQQ
jgi:hypothetical protein